MTREDAIAFGNRVIDLGFRDETQVFCEMAINALEQEPCEDAVSRQSVLEELRTCFDTHTIYDENNGENYIIYEDAVDMMEKLPSVTPARKKGKWIDGHCSECGCDVPAYIDDWKWIKDMDAKFCPKCGAEMESEE